MKSVLVVAPHGLDEALGCGASMARHADEGHSVHVLVLFGDGTGADAGRRAAASDVARILGVATWEVGGFPENRSDTVPLVDLVAVVERRIKAVAADTLYVPHHGNLNIDHQTACQAAITAARPVPGQSVLTIYGYEILSSTDWMTQQPVTAFHPVRHVDISHSLDRKLAALQAYGAEMRPAPHSRSPDGVRALAAHRGMSVGMSAAEAFTVLRDLLPASGSL